MPNLPETITRSPGRSFLSTRHSAVCLWRSKNVSQSGAVGELGTDLDAVRRLVGAAVLVGLDLGGHDVDDHHAQLTGHQVVAGADLGAVEVAAG